MFIFRVLLAAGLLALSLPAAAAQATQKDGEAYALANTTVKTLHAKQLARDYQVFVSLPTGYTDNGPALPVVFVTDADYAFPLTRAIRARVGISPFILVGLLGAHILLTAPQMFSRYVISSPSLWYDDGVIFSRQKKFVATQTDLNANVFFSVGALEAAGDDDMVADLKNFDSVLRSRRYPHLKTQVHVWRGKDHLDVFPEMITAALKWAVPRSR